MIQIKASDIKNISGCLIRPYFNDAKKCSQVTAADYASLVMASKMLECSESIKQIRNGFRDIEDFKREDYSNSFIKIDTKYFARAIIDFEDIRWLTAFETMQEDLEKIGYIVQRNVYSVTGEHNPRQESLKISFEVMTDLGVSFLDFI